MSTMMTYVIEHRVSLTPDTGAMLEHTGNYYLQVHKYLGRYVRSACKHMAVT